MTYLNILWLRSNDRVRSYESEQLFWAVDEYIWSKTAIYTGWLIIHEKAFTFMISVSMRIWKKSFWAYNIHFVTQNQKFCSFYRILSYHEIRLGWNSLGWNMLIFSFQTVNKHVEENCDKGNCNLYSYNPFHSLTKIILALKRVCCIQNIS